MISSSSTANSSIKTLLNASLFNYAKPRTHSLVNLLRKMLPSRGFYSMKFYIETLFEIY